MADVISIALFPFKNGWASCSYPTGYVFEEKALLAFRDLLDKDFECLELGWLPTNQHIYIYTDIHTLLTSAYIYIYIYMYIYIYNLHIHIGTITISGGMMGPPDTGPYIAVCIYYMCVCVNKYVCMGENGKI